MIEDEVVIRAVELVMLLVVVDLGLAWVQTDIQRWPRRLTYLAMTPLRVPTQWLLRWVPTGSWDISPVVIVALLTLLRVWWTG